ARQKTAAAVRTDRRGEAFSVGDGAKLLLLPESDQFGMVGPGARRFSIEPVRKRDAVALVELPGLVVGVAAAFTRQQIRITITPKHLACKADNMAVAQVMVDLTKEGTELVIGGVRL